MVSIAMQNPLFAVAGSTSPGRAIIVISDDLNLVANIESTLSSSSVQVLHYAPDEIRIAEVEETMLVVLDIGAHQIPVVLQMLRSAKGYRDIPILVEARRVIDRYSVSSLLNHYRAMPCSHADLLKLVRRLASKATPGEARDLL